MKDIKRTICCPYCGYDFYDDKPDISWETEKYLIDNNIPVSKTPAQIFECCDNYYGAIIICYGCSKRFTVDRIVTYYVKKINDDEEYGKPINGD